jgi:hypothetical protein
MTGITFESAFLADYVATPPGGQSIFTIVGGGINILYRSGFPAPMKCHLMCICRIDENYTGEGVDIVITVKSADDADVYAKVQALGLVGDPLPRNTPNSIAPVTVDLGGVALPRAGNFVVDATIDGVTRTVPFMVQFAEVTTA